MESNKRVILIVSVFPQTTETFIVSKFLGLLEKGWDAHVVCKDVAYQNIRNFDGRLERAFNEQRIHQEFSVGTSASTLFREAFRLTKRILSRPLKQATYLFNCLRAEGVHGIKTFILDSTIAELLPATVHFEFGALAIGRVKGLHANSVRLSVSFRGFDVNFFAPHDPLIYTTIDPYLTSVHVIGEDIRKCALLRGCASANTAVVISPAVDANYFHPSKSISRRPVEESGKVVLLSVGRLERKKGYTFALDAVRMLVEDGVTVEYRIVGEGSDESNLRAKIDQLGIAKYVHLLGKQNRESIRDELGNCDIFIQASLSEGFCNAVIEAQSMARAVIATDAGGLPENIVDGITGLIVAKGDSVSLCNAVSILAHDGALRERLGNAGRIRVLENFTLEQQSAKWDSFFGTVSKTRGNG